MRNNKAKHSALRPNNQDRGILQLNDDMTGTGGASHLPRQVASDVVQLLSTVNAALPPNAGARHGGGISGGMGTRAWATVPARGNRIQTAQHLQSHTNTQSEGERGGRRRGRGHAGTGGASSAILVFTHVLSRFVFPCVFV